MMLWVKRKHSKRLIKRNVSKYIVKGKTASNHKWVWGINSKDNDKENEIKPIRYPLLKLNINPYLLKDREYFKKRMIIKNLEKLFIRNITTNAHYVMIHYIMVKMLNFII